MGSYQCSGLSIRGLPGTCTHSHPFLSMSLALVQIFNLNLAGKFGTNIMILLVHMFYTYICVLALVM